METKTHNLHLGSQKCHYASNYYAADVLKSGAFVKKFESWQTEHNLPQHLNQYNGKHRIRMI
jgi:hypothetical protein